MEIQLDYLEQLTELLHTIKRTEDEIRMHQATVNSAKKKAKKDKAKQKLQSSTEELEDLRRKEIDLRRRIQDSWGNDYEMTRNGQRDIPDEEGSDDSSEVSFTIMETNKTMPAISAPTRTSSASNRGLKMPKPDRFKRGENFTRFCEDFKDYVKLGKVESSDLNLYFLGLLDGFTKDKLKDIVLTPDQRADAGAFLPIYIEKVTPRHEADNLKLKLCDLRQEKGQTIEDFAYKLREISSRAYGTGKETEATKLAACYSSFIKGLASQEVRIKLRENIAVTGFEQAVDEACRLQDIRDSESLNRGTPSHDSPLPPVEVLQISENSGTATEGRSSYRRHDAGYTRSRDGPDSRHNNYRENSRSRDRTRDRSWTRDNDRSRGSYRTRGSSRARGRGDYYAGAANTSSQDDAEGNNTHQDTGNASDSRGRGSSQSNNRRDDRQNRRQIICYRCQQPNHRARDCTLNE